MPIPSNILLKHTTQHYHLVTQQSLVVCTITSPDDATFNVQFRFIEDPTKKINLTQLATHLKSYIQKGNATKKLFFNEENKLNFLNSLKNIEFELSCFDLIHSNTRYKLDAEATLAKEFNADLFSFFCLDVANPTDKINFGYEIPEDPCSDRLPMCCAYIFDNKKLTKKIFLFPLDGESLEEAQVKIINAVKYSNLELAIPFVVQPLNHTEDRSVLQTRINLQTLIAEILRHLKQPKSFRKNGAEKYKIFSDLAKDIAQAAPLASIKTSLDSYNKFQILAQHRDPWGFFSFFRGKTHSLLIWGLLQQAIDAVPAQATVNTCLINPTTSFVAN